MSDVENRVRERAYYLWLREGCSEGRADVHWDKAREHHCRGREKIPEPSSLSKPWRMPANFPPSRTRVKSRLIRTGGDELPSIVLRPARQNR
jgi:hypothetical protein